MREQFNKEKNMRNILVVAMLLGSFFLVGCSNNSKNKEQTTEAKPVLKQTKEITKVAQKPQEKVEPKEQVAQEVTQKAVKKAKEITKKAVEIAQKSTKKVIEATKKITKQVGDNEMVKSVAKKVEDSTKALSGMIPTSLTSAATSKKVSSDTDEKAKKLFAKCAGCHGNKAQNKALGVSKVIAGWDTKKIEDAIKGYKAGTYGGAMKGVMKSQVATLSDADIKVLAEYISKLK